MKKKFQTGSTIIEVLIATVVVGLVLTSVAALLTVSVKNTAQLRYRSQATTAAQSALEVFRRERGNLGWEAFYTAIQDGTYCLNNLPANSTAFVGMPRGTCNTTFELLNTSFKRQALVAKTDNPDGTQQVRVDMTMSWFDGVRPQQVTLSQIFKRVE